MAWRARSPAPAFLCRALGFRGTGISRRFLAIVGPRSRIPVRPKRRPGVAEPREHPDFGTGVAARLRPGRPNVPGLERTRPHRAFVGRPREAELQRWRISR